MTSDATRRALDQSSRKAGVGQPASAPNNTTRNVIAAVSKKAGLPSGPSRAVANTPVERDIESKPLDHRQRAEQANQEHLAAQRKELARHGQLAQVKDR